MPSRPPPQSHHHHHHQPVPVPPLAAGAGIIATLFFALLCLCRKRIKKPKTSTPSPPSRPSSIRRYSYSFLRRATSNFSPSTRLGQGGFGSVHLATTPSNKKVAVKVMEAGSLQGEREFQNEIAMFDKIGSPNKYIVSLLGFVSKRHSLLLVYEYMCNGSLQDALLHRKDVRLKAWENRFLIALDVANGIEFLHSCDPPIVHCDIKPSNILLDGEFRAKIGDFGLSRFVEVGDRKEDVMDICIDGVVDDDNAEVESVTTVTTMGLEDFSVCIDQSPESVFKAGFSPEEREKAEMMLSPETNVAESPLNENINAIGIVAEKEIKEIDGGGEVKLSGNSLDVGSRRPNEGVKDYVMEWIGTEVRKDRPKSNWVGVSSSSAVTKEKKDKTNFEDKKQLKWWVSLEDDKSTEKARKDRRRPVREWWREEYSKELAKQQKKKKRKLGIGEEDGVNNYRPRDGELYVGRKNISRNGSKNSRGSIDRWLDGLSGELWKGQSNSYDSASCEIGRSGGITSTPSMRGTVCYVAPEYGGAGLGDFSERCDVYSYGVLLLVLIAGRRPLQVTGSPVAEFKRANLISWARTLARRGKLLDLVDKSVELLNKEQALLCIKVALLCIQKSPLRRPSMKEVVGMLSGVLELPQLPQELFASPSSHFTFKPQKNLR